MTQNVVHLPAAVTDNKQHSPSARRSTDAAPDFVQAADESLVRAADLVRDPRRPGKVTLLPFSKSSLERRVRTGDFPAPIKLGTRVTAWRLGDVRQWLAQQQGE